MEWLSQNWMWLVLAGGVFWFLARGRAGGVMPCCGGHDAAKKPAAEARDPGTEPMSSVAEDERRVPVESGTRSRGHGGACHRDRLQPDSRPLSP